MFSLFRRLGIRHITAQPVRALMVVGAIALGVATLTAVQLVNDATLRAVEDSVSSMAGAADLQVSGPSAGFSVDVREVVRGATGVAAVVPLVRAEGFEARTGEGIQVLGVDLVDEGTVRTYRREGAPTVLDDPILFLAQPNSMLLAKDVAERLGVGVDETLTMSTATGVKDFVVRGILDPDGIARIFAGNLALMDIGAAQLAFGRGDLVDQLDVVLDEGVDPDAVAAALARDLPPALQVERPQKRGEKSARVLASIQALLTGLASVGLLVAAFIMYNTVAMAISQRQREIAVARLVGAGRAQVVGALALESVLVAAIGAVLGIGLGILIGTVLLEPIEQAFTAALTIRFSTGGLTIAPGVLARMLAIGIATGLAGSLVPALRCVRGKAITAAERRIGASRAKLTRRGLLVALLVLMLNPLTVLWLSLDPFASDAAVTVLLVVGIAALVVGVALLLPHLLAGLAAKLRGPLEARSGAVSHIVADALLHSPSRTAATVMILAAALAFMVLGGSLARSFEGTVRDWADKLYPGLDLSYESAHKLAGWKAAPFSDELVELIGGGPGVEVSIGRALVHVPYDGGRVLLEAADFKTDCAKCGVLGLGIPLGGDDEKMRKLVPAGQGAVISDVLAARSGLRIGDTITLDAPARRLSLPILGIVPDYSSSEGLVMIARSLYADAWHDRTVHTGTVVVAPGHDREAVRREIVRRYGEAHQIVVTTTNEKVDQIADMIRASLGFLSVLEGLALGIALFGVVQVVLVSAFERLRDIAVLRALGLTKRQLWAALLGESLAIGTLGAVTGLALGTVLAYEFAEVYLRPLVGWALTFHFPAGFALLGALMAIAVSLLAGLFPARRVSAVPLAACTRYE